MAEYKRGGLDSKALAERKSKRLQEALSAFTPEQTKETVSKLLEEYVDESGKNYFGAGTRDTTLYFADDEYIREIEKEKNKNRKPEKKSSVVNKFHKLTSIIPKSEHNEDNKETSSQTKSLSSDNNTEQDTDLKSIAEIVSEKEEKINNDRVVLHEKASQVEESSNEISSDIQKSEPAAINTPLRDTSENKNETSTQTFPEPEPTVVITPVKDTDEIKEKQKAETVPEPEPTIVIKPVKEDDIKTKTPAKEETNQMRREFFDNEIEVEEVPRRRRKQADPETIEKDKQAPDINIDEDDNKDPFPEDTEIEEKKSKFGSFFKRKKSDPFDDDFDEDEEFDDDDYYDDEDDDYDYEEGITFKKVLNAVVIIALICSTAFFAASNYSNLKKLESANTQINELNNGTSGNSEDEINALKTQVDTLTAENERLKGNTGTPANTSEPTSSSAPAADSGNDSSDSTTGTGSGSTYTIKAGDTGSKICTAVYGQYTEELWQKILEANGMTTSTVYHPGDVLQIP